MNERVERRIKTPEPGTGRTILSKNSQLEKSASECSLADRILLLQRTAGNRTVERLFKSGVLRTEVGSGGKDYIAASLTGTPVVISRSPFAGIQCAGEKKAVYEALFVKSPSKTPCQKWQKSTEQDLFNQFSTELAAFIKGNPLKVYGSVTPKVNENDVDQLAVKVNGEIINKFGTWIGKPLEDEKIQDRVQILSPAKTADPEFVKQWLANRLYMCTKIADYCVDEDDSRFKKLVAKIMADAGLMKSITMLANRQAAFVEGEGESRTVHIHKGATPTKAEESLAHELVHFYAHPDYKAWNAKMIAPRYADDGITEYLAREIAPSRTNYQDRYDFIKDEVAKYVSLDDIAAAYFAGKVWLVEDVSKVAKKLFGEFGKKGEKK